MSEDDATTTPVSPRHAAPDAEAPPTRQWADTEPAEPEAADPDPSAVGARHSRTAHGRHGTRRRRPGRRMVVLGVVAALAAAGVFLVGMAVGGWTSPPTPVTAPALPVAAPPIVPASAPPPAATTTSPTSTSHTSPASTHQTTTRTTVRPAADTGAGCGHRAVARGVFNPACSEYQGYLDPGRAAGRAPSSGDLQHDDGCQKGYIPQSEC